ncbi:OmpA family protein [Alterisphingorhabdus coralli]|uniref:OmpA family protein n=1 Tax=Alterisphingorhabdus coralli TaxID=3071408 RepID=A0AA97F6Y4_9SPHN|nr:OmpA family protein [Parasphingorhabdus sp. SCSIO 66989]WOE75076.1 OmpA family protein [Parasphingorhabdus sp. SCSIO 66989]
MRLVYRNSCALLLAGLLAATASSGLSAQEQYPTGQDEMVVYGTAPADLTGLAEGPEIKGIISARSGEKMQVTAEDGSSMVVLLSEATNIRAKGGFLGLERTSLGADALLNGLPVEIRTVQWNDSLVASRVRFSNTNLKTANMIRSGTAQGFAEQSAATEALRGRLGDIDKYNIKRTANVYFDSGKANLSPAARDELCYVAREADGIDNSLMLVVGYTDSTGSQEVNQRLSEKRAGRVVNYLQQACGWKPYRMLTPTGMASADPQADNSTAAGKAQNRRVSVNVLVSKGLDGL